MDLKYKGLLAVLLLALSGCSITHEYKWNEYKLTPDRLPPQYKFRAGNEVKVIKGESDTTRKYIGGVGAHNYYANMQILTDGLVEHLTLELQNKKIKVNEGATKSLKITVNNETFERGMWSIAATLNFDVEFGDGNSKSFSVRNKSPGTVENLYNGVIARSVIAIMEDAEVQKYINN